MFQDRVGLKRYTAPGVYFEAQDFSGRRSDTRTDVVGFVGVAERGPLNRSIKIESWDQYRSSFGDVIAEGLLPYAVRSFFDNGGVTCWIVRAGQETTDWKACADVALPEWPDRFLRIEAVDRGDVGEKIYVQLLPRPGKRVTLVVRRGQRNLIGTSERETWQDLMLDDNPRSPRAEASRFVDRVLGNPGPDEGSALIAATVVRGRPLVNVYPRDAKHSSVAEGTSRVSGPIEVRLQSPPGASRYQLEQKPELGDLIGRNLDDNGRRDRRGLEVFECRPEVSIVAIPDLVWTTREVLDIATTPRCDRLSERPAFSRPRGNLAPARQPLTTDEIFQGQQALIKHCEMQGDRFALLDPPADFDPEKIVREYGKRAEQSRGLRSSFAALYYPWIRVADPLPERMETLFSAPPSGAVAGVFARVDQTLGVHKAPANERLRSVQAVERGVPDTVRGMLNDQGVNAIVPVPGRGIRIMGARTLTPPDRDELRSVNVRRLLLAIETEVRRLGATLVLESNTQQLQADVERAVRAYLGGLWRRGQLDGETAEQAYSVRCDDSTNPAEERDLGRLICEIGVKPPLPAEFVIVRVGISLGESMEAANA